MGVDIDGWVEVKEGTADHPYWKAVIQISDFMPVDEVVCGLLFYTPCSYLDYPLVAADRGLPPDASYEAADTLANDWCVTWIGWDEILAIPDDIPAAGEYVYVYWPGQGYDPAVPVYTLPLDEVAGCPGYVPGLREWEEPPRPPGSYTWRSPAQYRIEPAKPWRTIIGKWQILFDMLAILGRAYGDANVRLVVGFNN